MAKCFCREGRQISTLTTKEGALKLWARQQLITGMYHRPFYSRLDYSDDQMKRLLDLS